MWPFGRRKIYVPEIKGLISQEIKEVGKLEELLPKIYGDIVRLADLVGFLERNPASTEEVAEANKKSIAEISNRININLNREEHISFENMKTLFIRLRNRIRDLESTAVRLAEVVKPE